MPHHVEQGARSLGSGEGQDGVEKNVGTVVVPPFICCARRSAHVGTKKVPSTSGRKGVK